MPTFKIRLEDPDSSEFRLVAIAAPSADDAVAELQRRERKKVDFRLTTDEMAALEREGGPTAKAKLLTHHQAKPYEVVSVEDYTGGFWGAAAEARAARRKED